MAAKDNINRRQFIKVFRGFGDREPDEIDYEKLGMHWSTNAWVAHDFATNSNTVTNTGTVLEGKVDKSHLITPEHPNWREFRAKHVIFGPDSKQREMTVLPGSPVKIFQAHHIMGEEGDEIYTYKAGLEYDELSKPVPKKGIA